MFESPANLSIIHHHLEYHSFRTNYVIFFQPYFVEILSILLIYFSKDYLQNRTRNRTHQVKTHWWTTTVFKCKYLIWCCVSSHLPPFPMDAKVSRHLPSLLLSPNFSPTSWSWSYHRALSKQLCSDLSLSDFVGIMPNAREVVAGWSGVRALPAFVRPWAAVPAPQLRLPDRMPALRRLSTRDPNSPVASLVTFSQWDRCLNLTVSCWTDFDARCMPVDVEGFQPPK